MAAELVFLDPGQIESIAEVAFAALEGYATFMDRHVGRGEAEHARMGDDFDAAIEALRFCATIAGRTGDAAFAPLLHDIGAELTRWAEHASRHRDVVALAVRALLRRGAAVDDGIELLARHQLACVRQEVAQGLAAAGAGLPLLEALARDPNADVRTAALAKLATVRDIPWWSSAFPSDPIGRLSPAEAARHRGALEAVAKAAAGRGDGLAAAIKKLPDPFAAEAAEAALGDPTAHRQSGGPAIAAELLVRPGGVDALVRLAAKWAAGDDRHRVYAGEHVAAEAAAAIPKKRRLALALTLARVAAAAAPGPEREPGTAASILAKVAGAAFPAGADPTPLLEIALGMPHEAGETDGVSHRLLEPLAAESANLRRCWARLFEARLAGWPGAYRHLHQRDAILMRAPARLLRRAAEQALVSEDDDTATWALSALLGPAHDRARDGTRAAVVRRFFAEPRYRALLGRTGALAELAIPELRAELRAGRLGFAAARNALTWITCLWGGAAPIVYFGSTREAPAKDPGKAERAKLKGLLGPAALQGPPTDEEWERYRAARAAEPPHDWITWREQMALMPPGPWHAADRALLDLCLAEARAGEGGHAWLAAMAVAGKPCVEDAALMDELAAMPDDRDHGYVLENRLRFREALGLATGDEEVEDGEPAPEGKAVAWMDREDD
jgi:hypothetical protein